MEFYEGRDTVFTEELIIEEFYETDNDISEKLIFEYDNTPIGYGHIYVMINEYYEHYHYEYKNEAAYCIDQFIGMEDCYLMEYRYKDNATNPSAVKYLLEHNFTDFHIDQITFIGNGNDSYVYEINNRMIFKFPRHEKANRNLKKELEILQFLENKLSYNIPKVLYRADPSLVFPYSIAGYSKIDGVPLSKELYENLSPEQKELLTQDLAGFLRELHSLNYQNYEENILTNFQHDHDKLKDLVYERLDDIIKANVDQLYHSILSNPDFTCINQALIIMTLAAAIYYVMLNMAEFPVS